MNRLYILEMEKIISMLPEVLGPKISCFQEKAPDLFLYWKRNLFQLKLFLGQMEDVINKIENI